MKPCQRIQTVLIGLNELLQKIKNVELGEDIYCTQGRRIWGQMGLI